MPPEARQWLTAWAARWLEQTYPRDDRGGDIDAYSRPPAPTRWTRPSRRCARRISRLPSGPPRPRHSGHPGNPLAEGSGVPLGSGRCPKKMLCGAFYVHPGRRASGGVSSGCCGSGPSGVILGPGDTMPESACAVPYESLTKGVSRTPQADRIAHDRPTHLPRQSLHRTGCRPPSMRLSGRKPWNRNANSWVERRPSSGRT